MKKAFKLVPLGSIIIMTSSLMAISCAADNETSPTKNMTFAEAKTFYLNAVKQLEKTVVKDEAKTQMEWDKYLKELSLAIKPLKDATGTDPKTLDAMYISVKKEVTAAQAGYYVFLDKLDLNVLTGLRAINSVSISSNVITDLNSQFFDKALIAVKKEIAKNSKLIGVAPTIVKNKDADGKVWFTTNKTRNQVYKVGLTTGDTTLTPNQKFLMTNILQSNSYDSIKGRNFDKFIIVVGTKTITLEKTNNAWTTDDPTSTDITTAINGTIKIGPSSDPDAQSSKIWAYIQKVLLKTITVQHITIIASNKSLTNAGTGMPIDATSTLTV